MKLLEYEAKRILTKYGILTPKGESVANVAVENGFATFIPFFFNSSRYQSA